MGKLIEMARGTMRQQEVAFAVPGKAYDINDINDQTARNPNGRGSGCGTIPDILAQLDHYGAEIWAVDGRLRLRGRVPPDVVAALREHKDDLPRLLLPPFDPVFESLATDILDRLRWLWNTAAERPAMLRERVAYGDTAAALKFIQELQELDSDLERACHKGAD